MSQKSHSIIDFDEISINCYSLYSQDAIISMIYYIEDFPVKYDSIPVLQIFPESQTNGYKAHSKLKRLENVDPPVPHLTKRSVAPVHPASPPI